MTDLRVSLPAEPMSTLAAWLAQAERDAATPNPNAMSLATVDERRGEIMPAARIVLCKAVDTHSGYLVFFTNYRSRKAEQLARHAKAAAVFHFDAAGRQARVEGHVLQSPAAESDAYFASRARGSQLGAWASAQSEPIASRAALIAQLEAVRERFDGVDNVPRPPHWGGFRLWASAVELWQAGEHRLHDRVCWIRTLALDDDGQPHAQPWSATRLQP